LLSGGGTPRVRLGLGVARCGALGVSIRIAEEPGELRGGAVEFAEVPSGGGGRLGRVLGRTLDLGQGYGGGKEFRNTGVDQGVTGKEQARLKALQEESVLSPGAAHVLVDTWRPRTRSFQRP
jgi:hypothetical protein